jgi:hypothetical protein
MRHVARLCSPSGQALLPARTPDDYEQLFRHLAHRVHRDGTVALELDAHAWLVTVSGVEDEHVCPCGAPLHGLTFRADGGLACLCCVRAMLNEGRSRIASLLGFTPGERPAAQTA